jgi:hypothetical protein
MAWHPQCMQPLWQHMITQTLALPRLHHMCSGGAHHQGPPHTGAKLTQSAPHAGGALFRLPSTHSPAILHTTQSRTIPRHLHRETLLLSPPPRPVQHSPPPACSWPALPTDTAGSPLPLARCCALPAPPGPLRRSLSGVLGHRGQRVRGLALAALLALLALLACSSISPPLSVGRQPTRAQLAVPAGQGTRAARSRQAGGAAAGLLCAPSAPSAITPAGMYCGSCGT